MKSVCPLVSIIVPVYNTDLQYLKECLDSIKLQNYSNTEVIIIDDGSNEKTNFFLKNYLESISKQTGEWKLIEQENQGLSAARNIGYEHSKGEYIQFLDADDYFDKRLISTAVNIAERDNSDVVVYNFEVFDMELGIRTVVYSSDRFPIGHSFSLNDIDTKIGLIAYNVWSKMFKKEYLDSIELLHDVNLRRAEDVLFTYTALTQSKRVSFQPQKYITYRENIPGSNTATNDQYPVDSIKSWNSLYDLLQEKDLYYLYKKDFENAMVGSLYWHLERLHTDQARIAFGDASHELFKKIELLSKNDQILSIEVASVRPDLIVLIDEKNNEIKYLQSQLEDIKTQTVRLQESIVRKYTGKLKRKMKYLYAKKR